MSQHQPCEDRPRTHDELFVFMTLSSSAVARITVSAIAHLLPPPLITQAVADVQKSTCRRVISPLKPHLVPRSTDRALCCCKRSCFWESVRAGCMVSAYSLRHSLSTSLTYLSDGGGVGNHFDHQDLWYQPNPAAGRTPSTWSTMRSANVSSTTSKSTRPSQSRLFRTSRSGLSLSSAASTRRSLLRSRSSVFPARHHRHWGESVAPRWISVNAPTAQRS
jgi:hypothetical protein